MNIAFITNFTFTATRLLTSSLIRSDSGHISTPASPQDLFQFTFRHSGSNSDQTSHAENFIFRKSSGLSAYMMCLHTSSRPPRSPSVCPLLSLFLDVIGPLCSHFTMAILHLFGLLRMSVSPSAGHVNVWVFLHLFLSIWFNLNWELGMQNGMREIVFSQKSSCDTLKACQFTFQPSTCLSVHSSLSLRTFPERLHQSAKLLRISPQHYICLKPSLRGPELFFCSFISEIYNAVSNHS